MGGTGTFEYFDSIKGYVVAMTGDFEGGVFVRAIAEPRIEGARTFLELEHCFVRFDGSTFQTRDTATLTKVEGEERLLAATTYNIVSGKGAFEHMRGSFNSWGAIDPRTGQGVLRFWGEISEIDE
jgi:hypothetical protein